MLNKIDFIFLKRTLIFFIVSIIFAGTLIVVGMQYEKTQYENYIKGQNKLKGSHRQFKKMVNDIDLLELYTTKFTDYKSTGLVGGERRLSWIESLKSTNSVLKIPKLTYSLLPQEGYIRSGLKPGKNVAVNSSPMELNMSLLHEEDLYALLEGLSTSITNLFTVDRCNFKLIGEVGRSFDTKKANLTTNCVIRWISIDVK